MTKLLFCSLLITSFSGLGLIACLLLSRTLRATSERVLQVTQGLSAGPGSLIAEQPQAPAFTERIHRKVREVRARLGMNETAKLLDRFMHAGFKTAAARDTYFAARMLGPLIAIIVASIIPFNKFFWMTTLGGLLYLAPDFILGRLVKGRREKIRRSIPDAIDLLVICVDAGLGMDQAMLRVGQELGSSHPEIYEEFLQINREQRAGLLRLSAWQAMAARSKLTEIDGFVNMLMQTERFGTPIARALSNFGDGIRMKRRQRAEELAAKTTVKIIFPLVLCIFPSMFIVLLGPAGITIARGLAEMTH